MLFFIASVCHIDKDHLLTDLLFFSQACYIIMFYLTFSSLCRLYSRCCFDRCQLCTKVLSVCLYVLSFGTEFVLVVTVTIISFSQHPTWMALYSLIVLMCR